MATKSVLPAQLKQPKLRDVRNNNLSGAIPATGVALAGGVATAAGLSSLATLAAPVAATATTAASVGIPALAALLSNPITAPIAVTLGAVLVASPWIYNKAKQWSVYNKIDHHERQIQKLSQDPNTANDPKLQAKLQHSQQRLGQLTGNPTSPQPQSGQHQAQVGNLLGAGGGKGVTDYGNGQSGPPESSLFGGTRAYNEQVPLFTPNQQAYQNETIAELRNNPANFNGIRDEELRAFHEETAPRIANQYFGRNPHSLSGAYPEALGRGGAQLHTKLAALQQKAAAEREGRLQKIGMAPSYTSVQHAREPGLGEDILRSVAKSGTNYIGGLASDYAGNWVKNTFGGSNTDDAKQAAVGTKETQPTTATAQPINFGNQSSESLGQFGNQNSGNDLYANTLNPLKKLLEQDALNKNNYVLGGGKR